MDLSGDRENLYKSVYCVLLRIRFFVMRKIYNVRCVCYMLRIFCHEHNTVHFSSFSAINNCFHGGRGEAILLCRPKIDVYEIIKKTVTYGPKLSENDVYNVNPSFKTHVLKGKKSNALNFFYFSTSNRLRKLCQWSQLPSDSRVLKYLLTSLINTYELRTAMAETRIIEIVELSEVKKCFD